MSLAMDMSLRDTVCTSHGQGMDNDKPVAHALTTACTHSDHSGRVTAGRHPDRHN